jgi:hypothetical protein
MKKIRIFLGLTSYYRKLLKNYDQIETPLKTLLMKESFSWTQVTIKYFEKLKEAMCTTHVLTRLDFTKTFIMEWDA